MKSCGYRKFALAALAAVLLAGCNSRQGDEAKEAPPPVQVVHVQDISVIQVQHPEQFPLASATGIQTVSKLIVTGVVNPDISRAVPVISLASGRVAHVQVRLGDTVKKGQLLMQVRSDDISGAFADYHKAQADETLAQTEFNRAKDLYAHGAIALSSLQESENTYQKAQADSEAAAQRVKLLGGDLGHPSALIRIYAPISGVITDQQVTSGSGVQGLASPNPFTISDLSYVWILCDVHENDLPQVRTGELAEIHADAYPGRVLKGRISNIGAVLDPNLRTAKVRVEIRNPGFLRVGMFVTAAFLSQEKGKHAVVPASAVLHLHDRDWVYVPRGSNSFERIAVTAGNMQANHMQEIVAGLLPGQKVVSNALELQNTIEQ